MGIESIKQSEKSLYKENGKPDFDREIYLDNKVNLANKIYTVVKTAIDNSDNKFKPNSFEFKKRVIIDVTSKLEFENALAAYKLFSKNTEDKLTPEIISEAKKFLWYLHLINDAISRIKNKVSFKNKKYVEDAENLWQKRLEEAGYLDSPEEFFGEDFNL